MRYLLISCLLLVSLAINAQSEKPCPCTAESNSVFQTKLKGQVYRALPGMIGIEFYNPKYLKGDVYLEDGQIAYDEQLRYNGRIDGVLLLPANSFREIILDKYFIKEFSIKDFMGATVYFKKIKVVKEFSSDSTNIFGQVLFENKLSLFAYRRYIFEQDVNEYVGGKQVALKSFVPSFIYYFKLPSNKTIGFKSFRKRNLYKLFPGNKDLMKKLFREKHQHRFKKEADLIRITEILNSMFN